MLAYDPVLAAEGAALVRAFFAECSIFGGLALENPVLTPDFQYNPHCLDRNELSTKVLKAELYIEACKLRNGTS